MYFKKLLKKLFTMSLQTHTKGETYNSKFLRQNWIARFYYHFGATYKSYTKQHRNEVSVTVTSSILKKM
jgi:hypothetical protein